MNSLSGKIEWLLDSGCSDHIVNNDEYFYESVVLKTPVNVKIADGRVLKATLVGNIYTNSMFMVKRLKIK